MYTLLKVKKVFLSFKPKKKRKKFAKNHDGNSFRIKQGKTTLKHPTWKTNVDNFYSKIAFYENRMSINSKLNNSNSFKENEDSPYKHKFTLHSYGFCPQT